MFSLKRMRVIAVYALLMASLVLSFLTTIATYTKFSDEASVVLKSIKLDTQSTNLDITRSSVTKLSFFALLTFTCSIALVTIARKDRSNARLLTQLDLSNGQLEVQVNKRTIELAEAIRAKDHFLGIAAHDLKAPISGIQGLVELIKTEKRGRDATEAEYLGHIENSCIKMQQLIHDILEINRIDQGRTVIKKEKVDLARLMNGLRHNFAPAAAKKGIKLIIENTDVIMETDANTLTRILENLLSNAIKFSPGMKKVWLNMSLGADQVRFDVVDEGPGIPPDEQPRLFSKFQRLSNQPTNSETSTGLGLSIVKELVAQLGGEISFRSEVGKGSTFIVTLPQTNESDVSSTSRKSERTDPSRQVNNLAVEALE